MFEPVVESLLQLLVQSIIMYVVLGPGPVPIDLSSMLFQSAKERVFYVVLLASSFFSVCISFAK